MDFDMTNQRFLYCLGRCCRPAFFVAVCLLFSDVVVLPCRANPHAVPSKSDITDTDPAAAAAMEAKLISNARQLTFEGRRAGEGYFSADGSKMVFQSERVKDNPFYQIYLLDFETGETRSTSPVSKSSK